MRFVHALRTNRHVEVKKNPGTLLQKFLHDTPEHWSVQVRFSSYAKKTPPISFLETSPFNIVFHTQPRIPMMFHFQFSHKKLRDITALYFSGSPTPLPF